MKLCIEPRSATVSECTYRSRIQVHHRREASTCLHLWLIYGTRYYLPSSPQTAPRFSIRRSLRFFLLPWKRNGVIISEASLFSRVCLPYRVSSAVAAIVQPASRACLFRDFATKPDLRRSCGCRFECVAHVVGLMPHEFVLMAGIVEAPDGA